MRRVHEAHKHSVKIKRQIARVIANLALHTDLHDPIIEAGQLLSVARILLTTEEVSLGTDFTQTGRTMSECTCRQ